MLKNIIKRRLNKIVAFLAATSYIIFTYWVLQPKSPSMEFVINIMVVCAVSLFFAFFISCLIGIRRNKIKAKTDQDIVLK